MHWLKNLFKPKPQPELLTTNSLLLDEVLNLRAQNKTLQDLLAQALALQPKPEEEKDLSSFLPTKSLPAPQFAGTMARKRSRATVRKLLSGRA